MAIALDTTVISITTGFGGTITKTWTHTVTGSNTLLVLAVDAWQDVAGTGTVTAATYNGVSMTLVAAVNSTAMRSELWYLKAPASGANTVSVTFTGNRDSLKFATTSFTGVDQTAPLDVSNTAIGSSGNPAISLTTATANAVVVSTLSRFSVTAATTSTTSLYNNVTSSTLGASSYQLATSTGSYTDTYTGASANDWSMVSASFKPFATASPSMQTLVDPFNQSSLNTGLWTQFTGGGATMSYSASGVTVTYPASTTASTDGDLTSVNTYDLTGSYAMVQVLAVPNAGGVTTTDGRLLLGNTANHVNILWEGGLLWAQQVVAGTNTNLANVSYSATNHKWWRIREASGTTYWETAPDAVNWTVLFSKANPIAVTALPVLLSGTAYNTAASPGTFKFSSFNTNAISTLLSPFRGTSLDTNLWSSDITGTGGITYTTSGVSATIGNTSTNPTYAKLHSVGSYNLYNSAIYLEVPSVSGGSVTDNYLALGMDGEPPSGNTNIQMDVNGGTLSGTYMIAGSFTSVFSISYSAIAHRWWRIREASGTLYFDTSPDAVTWTNRGSHATPFNVNSVKVNMSIRSYSTVSGLSPFTYDSVNVIQPTVTQTATARIISTVNKTQSAAARIRTNEPLAWVQSITGQNTATSLALTFASAVKAGHLIVVAVNCQNPGTISGISDSLGNTYTLATSTSTNSPTSVYYAYNVAGGSTVITVTRSGSAGPSFEAVAQEFSGTAITSPLDVTVLNADTTGSTTPTSTATASTTYPSDLVVGVIASVTDSNTITAGSGFTNLSRTSGVALAVAMESKVVSSFGPQTATFGLASSNANNTAAIVFKGYGLLVTNSQQAKAKITTKVTKTQTITARIASVATRTQSVTAHIKSVTGTTQTATAHIIQSSNVPTRYAYKSYAGNTFLGLLPNVTSEFMVSQDINTAGSQITITVGVSPDTSYLPATTTIDDENGNPIQDENGNNLLSEGAVNIVGVGVSSQTLIKNGNKIVVYEYSKYYPNGLVVFTGEMEKWKASFGGDGADDITILCYSTGQDMDNRVIQTGSTSLALQASAVATVTGAYWGTAFAQAINPASNISVGVIRLKLNLVSGSPITASIQLCSGDPSLDTVNVISGHETYTFGGTNAVIDTSSTVSISALTATVYTFTFPANHTLVSGSKYYVLMQFDQSLGAAIVVSTGDNTITPVAPIYRFYSGKVASNNSSIAMTYDSNHPVAYVEVLTIGGSTLSTYTSVDPSTGMLVSVMNDYAGQGGGVTYTASSIQSTGLSLTYTFNTNTTYEGVKAALSLAPSGFYYYVDVGSNILYFKQSSLTADVLLVRGRHIESLDIVASIENIANTVYFSGGIPTGNTTNLYKLYKDAGSIGIYGQRLSRKSDNRVTLVPTADAIGLSTVAESKDEQYQTVVTILDTMMDINTLKLGMIIGFRGFGTFADQLLAQVVRFDRTPHTIKLTLGILPRRLVPEFERITRGLVAEQTIANPTSPS